MKRFTLPLLLLSLPTAALAAPEFVQGEVLVRWKTALPSTLVASTKVGPTMAAPGSPHSLHRLAIREIQRVDRHTELLRLSAQTRKATLAAVRDLSGRPDVAFAQPNFIRRTYFKPDDPHLALQWNVEQTKVERAWDFSTGSADVVVAVVDTGIRPHPEFAARLVPGYDFISSDPDAADDQAGRDDDPTDTGHNAISSSAIHGTHVAGIIAATGNNGQGIAGVDWHCKVLPVRALGVLAGQGTDRDISDAIRWAAGLSVAKIPDNKNPAAVINLSFGGEGESAILTRAINEAMAAGAVVVAAAGNDGIDGHKTYPAAIPGVITVAATDQNKELAPYSNYGDVVDLVAPGGSLAQQMPFEHQGKQHPAGIVSTMYVADTGEFSVRIYEGTSQSAPLVAGVVALMVASYPAITPDKIREILKTTADPSVNCNEGCGAGMLDAGKAVEEARKLSPNPPPPPKKGDGLPFGASCGADSECAHKTCRGPRGHEARICTQYCSATEQCPESSGCDNGICVPSTIKLKTSNEPDPPVSEGVIVGGCAVTANRPTLTPPLLLLMLWWARRRARH